MSYDTLPFLGADASPQSAPDGTYRRSPLRGWTASVCAALSPLACLGAARPHQALVRCALLAIVCLVVIHQLGGHVADPDFRLPGRAPRDAAAPQRREAVLVNVNPTTYADPTGMMPQFSNASYPTQWQTWGQYLHGNLAPHTAYSAFRHFGWELSPDAHFYQGTTAPRTGPCADLPPLDRATLERAFADPASPLEDYLGAVVIPDTALAKQRRIGGPSAPAQGEAVWHRGQQDVLCAYMVSITPKPGRAVAAKLRSQPTLRVPGFAPDSLLWEAKGAHGYYSHAEYSPVPWEETFDHAVVRVYPTMVPLMDPDRYVMTALIEYQNYEWHLYRSDAAPYAPQPIPFVTLTTTSGGAPSLIAQPPLMELKLEVPGTELTLADYRALPVCTQGDHFGRWIPLDRLVGDVEAYWRQTRAHVDEYTLKVIDDNRVWVPYDCRYRHYTYDQLITDCLAPHYPYMHLAGDSNTRRYWKAVSSGGAWCSTWFDPKSHNCLCEDWDLDTDVVSHDTGRHFVDRIGTSPIQTVYTSWHGIVKRGEDWEIALNKTLMTQELQEHHFPDARAPDLSVIGLANWDAAFVAHGHTVTNLESFMERIENVYRRPWRADAKPNAPTSNGGPTRLAIYRGAQAYYPREPVQRYYSRMRLLATDLLLRWRMAQAGVAIWDTHLLGDRRGAPFTECNSNHATRLEIDVENQVLANLVCNAVM
ncbi:hypothetical protein CXG81DRAFT_19204 [Caulochytrium protostelioides]|uniref:Uncharacterized protein n=1 Tax=Caulochytrium protostelioides TaxID=1555241 RepID=A0A4P9X7K8_9FUNG|nr:hypothetical protein CXG81DRAFT_19204 [Caulochytrium protostelioides]|eukprot:RKP00931.1 hypothetical protein CXG81DRAFT_19204 [Caulochytrium protostelioides]